jgi:hypothetical protein
MTATGSPHDLALERGAETISDHGGFARMKSLSRPVPVSPSSRWRQGIRLGTAFAIGLGIALPAMAQWAWRDDAGRTVFSDQPPPASIKKEQILRQPAGNVISATPAPAAAPAPAGAATPAAPGAKPVATGPKTLAEREQEYRKLQQERADAEKKQAEEQALAARKQQECNRARGYLRQLEDGIRIERSDAQGNREILDDAQRSAEMARAREVMAATCN